MVDSGLAGERRAVETGTAAASDQNQPQIYTGAGYSSFGPILCQPYVYRRRSAMKMQFRRKSLQANDLQFLVLSADTVFLSQIGLHALGPSKTPYCPEK
jgi:hypothetical protein